MKKYIIAVLLLLSMLLSGCASPEKADGESEALPAVSDTLPFLEAGENILAASAGMELGSTVFTVNGEPVTAGEYLYWLAYSADYLMDNYFYYTYTHPVLTDEMADGVSYAEYIREAATERTVLFSIIRALASQYSIELDGADIKEIDFQYNAAVEKMGDESKLLSDLARMGLDKESYYSLMKDQLLYNKLKQSVSKATCALHPDSETIVAWCKERKYITADHILIKTTDIPDNDTFALEQKRTKAQSLLDDLLASTDIEAVFTEFADEYSEDIGHETYPVGYTFSPGTMEAAFEDAAYAVQPGELFPELVQTSYGYYIIFRKQLNINDPGMLADYLDSLLSDACAEAKLDFCEAYESISAVGFYDNLTTYRQNME